MKAESALSLKVRIAVVLLLWLGAGLIPAIFSEQMLESDGPHTELYARLDFIWFAPLAAAHGLAWAVLPGNYNEWHGRDAFEVLLTCLFICAFVAHIWFTITRRTMMGFVESSFALAANLAVGALCEVWYWHWDYHNMHG